MAIGVPEGRALGRDERQESRGRASRGTTLAGGMRRDSASQDSDMFSAQLYGSFAENCGDLRRLSFYPAKGREDVRRCDGARLYPRIEVHEGVWCIRVRKGVYKTWKVKV